MPFYDTITNYDDAMQALEEASSDVVADFGEEGLEAGWSDVVASVAFQCDRATGRELCRTQLGWVPRDLERHLGRKDWAI